MHLLARSRSLSFRIGGRVRKVRRLSRTAPLMTFIICTNPRSGSWLLSDGLASSGLAGNPREWFNPIVEQKRRAEWRRPLQRSHRRGVSRTGTNLGRDAQWRMRREAALLSI